MFSQDFDYKLKVFLLAFYNTLVVWLHIYFEYTSRLMVMIPVFLVLFVLSYLLFYYLLKFVEKLEFKGRDLSGKKKVLVFFIIAIAVLVYMLIWFTACAPGSWSKDSIDQYEQIVTENYNDWHPAIHTLLFFKLPMFITHSVSSIVLLQLIFFSITMGAMGEMIYELSGIRMAVISILLVILNPFVCFVAMFPWKDIAFTVGCVLCTVGAIQIYRNEKFKVWKLVALGILIGVTSLLRHNGVLFTVPLLFALFLIQKKKRWLMILGLAVLSIFLIKVPLYKAFNVEKPDERVVETVGVPVSIIANVAKETPEKMSDEWQKFIYSVGSEEIWNEYYPIGGFNSIKWLDINTDSIENAGYGKILKYTTECIIKSPEYSLKGFIGLTRFVYGYESSSLSIENSSYVVDNDYGIYSSGNDNLYKLLDLYGKFINNSIFKYLCTHGVVLIIILVFFASKFKLSDKKSMKKTMLLIPVLVYDYGTMLLLSGPDARFYVITFVMAPLLVVFTLNNYDGKIED